VPDKKPWELLRSNLDHFKGGDVEWTEEDWATYRGPIKTISSTDGGDRIYITFAWCARKEMTNVLPNGQPWFVTAERTFISLSRGKFQSAVEERNRQIHFEAEGKAGTFYPKGQNLSIRKVQGIPEAPNLRVVK